MAKDADSQAVREALGPCADLYLREARARPVHELGDLVEMLDLYLTQVRELVDDNPFIDMPLVERIGSCVRAMLALYPEVNEPCRAAIVGALRYFILEEDAEGDLDSIVGFDDDAQVANYVVQAFDLDIPLIPIDES